MTRAENVLRWLRGGKDRRLVWNGFKRAYKPLDPDDVMAVKKLGMVGHKVVDHLREAGHIEPYHRPLLPADDPHVYNYAVAALEVDTERQMSDLASICNACGGYGLRHERELEHELREARAEVERLNRHRDELSADRHRHLLEIRALDAEVERLQHAESVLSDMLNRQIDHTKEAQAEVERLRTALRYCRDLSNDPHVYNYAVAALEVDTERQFLPDDVLAARLEQARAALEGKHE